MNNRLLFCLAIYV